MNNALKIILFSAILISFAALIGLSLYDDFTRDKSYIKRNEKDNEYVIPSIHYIQDTRTGICWAYLASYTKHYGFTIVPCDSVKQYLNKK